MCKSVDGVNGTLGKVLDWSAWVARVLVIPLLGLLGWMWWTHEERIDEIASEIRVIQGNRFSSDDALDMLTPLQREIAAVRSELKQQEIDTLRRELEQLRAGDGR